MTGTVLDFSFTVFIRASKRMTKARSEFRVEERFREKVERCISRSMWLILTRHTTRSGKPRQGRTINATKVLVCFYFILYLSCWFLVRYCLVHLSRVFDMCMRFQWIVDVVSRRLCIGAEEKENKIAQ